MAWCIERKKVAETVRIIRAIAAGEGDCLSKVKRFEKTIETLRPSYSGTVAESVYDLAAAVYGETDIPIERINAFLRRIADIIERSIPPEI